MQGQMSIFDFDEFIPKEKHTRYIRKNEYEQYHCELCKFEYPLIKLVGEWPNQRQILLNKCPNCKAIVDVDEDIKRVNEIFNNRNKCKYSGHSCNKEELWKIASSLDEITCKKICCRNCDVRICGARCNGADEPLEPISPGK